MADKIHYFDNNTGNPINLGYLNNYYKIKDWDWSKYYIYNGSKYNTYNSCYKASDNSSNPVELLTPFVWDKTNGATIRFKESGLRLSPEKWNGIISIPNLQFSADSDYYYTNHTYMPTVIEPGTVVYFCRVERPSIDTDTTINLSCCDYNPKAVTLTTYNTTFAEDSMNVYITYYADTKIRIYIPNYNSGEPLEFNYDKDRFIDNAIPKRLLIELQAAGGGGASGEAAWFPGGTSGAGGGSGAYGCLILKLNLYETTTWRITLGKRGHGGSGDRQPGGSADPSSIAYVQGDSISSNNFDTVYTLGGGHGASGGSDAEAGGDGGTVSRDIVSSYYWNIYSTNGLKGRGENGAGETVSYYDKYTLSTYNLMTSNNQNGNQTTRGDTYTYKWTNKIGGGAPSILCDGDDDDNFGRGGRGGANGGNGQSENGHDGGYPITIIHLPLKN